MAIQLNLPDSLMRKLEDVEELGIGLQLDPEEAELLGAVDDGTPEEVAIDAAFHPENEED